MSALINPGIPKQEGRGIVQTTNGGPPYLMAMPPGYPGGQTSYVWMDDKGEVSPTTQGTPPPHPSTAPPYDPNAPKTPATRPGGATPPATGGGPGTWLGGGTAAAPGAAPGTPGAVPSGIEADIQNALNNDGGDSTTTRMIAPGQPFKSGEYQVFEFPPGSKKFIEAPFQFDPRYGWVPIEGMARPAPMGMIPGGPEGEGQPATRAEMAVYEAQLAVTAAQQAIALNDGTAEAKIKEANAKAQKAEYEVQSAPEKDRAALAQIASGIAKDNASIAESQARTQQTLTQTQIAGLKAPAEAQQIQMESFLRFAQGNKANIDALLAVGGAPTGQMLRLNFVYESIMAGALPANQVQDALFQAVYDVSGDEMSKRITERGRQEREWSGQALDWEKQAFARERAPITDRQEAWKVFSPYAQAMTQAETTRMGDLGQAYVNLQKEYLPLATKVPQGKGELAVQGFLAALSGYKDFVNSMSQVGGMPNQAQTQAFLGSMAATMAPNGAYGLGPGIGGVAVPGAGALPGTPVQGYSGPVQPGQPGDMSQMPGAAEAAMGVPPPEEMAPPFGAPPEEPQPPMPPQEFGRDVGVTAPRITTPTGMEEDPIIPDDMVEEHWASKDPKVEDLDAFVMSLHGTGGRPAIGRPQTPQNIKLRGLSLAPQ